MTYDAAESLANLRTQSVMQIPNWFGHDEKIKYLTIVIAKLTHTLNKLKEKNDVT